MSHLLISFGLVFGFVALLIVGVSGFTPESFAFAVIVLVGGMLVSLFVVDGLRRSESSPTKSNWVRRWRRKSKNHPLIWALPLLALAGWTAYQLIPGNDPYAIPDGEPALLNPPAEIQTQIVAAPVAEVPSANVLPKQVSQRPAQDQKPVSTGTEAEQDVAAAVEIWRSAWASRDVHSYLAAYAPNFKPAEGLSIAQWRNQREERIGKARDIRVDLVEPAIDIHGDQATARFLQRYESGKFKDEMRKHLSLMHTSEGWKIIEERQDTSGKN